MRSLCMTFVALLFCALCASSGELYGTITDGTKPIGAGVKVDVSASGKVYSAETDKFGSYRIFVREKGKCTLTVHLKESSAAAELFSYDKSTRYDWILEMQHGKITLRRK